MKIEERVDLADYTTFRCGGPARFFARVANNADLKEAVVFAEKNNLPYFVLAGGSNCIISQKGFNGLVIYFSSNQLEIDDLEVIADAGVEMKAIVDETIHKSLVGFEWAGGLPGSVGGAVRGNAGAFGGEIKDNVVSVESYNPQTKEFVKRDKKQCRFDYRESVFKSNLEIITKIVFRLQPGDRDNLRQIADSRIAYRQKSHPIEYGSAGSIFKNVPVKAVSAELAKQYQDFIKTDPFPVIPTARLIFDAGCIGWQVGKAQVSHKHCNYIVNLGGATGEEIIELIDRVKAAIFDRFQVRLEIEPQLIGFD